MYNYLRRLYLESLLSEAGLDNAVNKFKWITKSQGDAIKAEKAERDTPTPEPTEPPVESNSTSETPTEPTV